MERLHGKVDHIIDRHELGLDRDHLALDLVVQEQVVESVDGYLASLLAVFCRAS